MVILKGKKEGYISLSGKYSFSELLYPSKEIFTNKMTNVWNFFINPSGESEASRYKVKQDWPRVDSF